MRKARTSKPNAVVHACAAVIGCASPLLAQAEPFIGQFELKTLDSEPGALEFQSQNAWAWDQPSRRVQAGDDELLFDENSLFKARYALELEIGLSERYKMRIGVEGERERIDDPQSIAEANSFDSLEFGEIGAEIVTILVPREGDGLGVGAVVEIEGPIDQEEPNHLSIGPIIEFQAGKWLAAAVPMAVYAFGGDREDGEPRDTKWDFAYAAQLKRELSPSWSAAIEAYGTVERLGNTGHRSESSREFGDFNQHRAGIIFYYAHEFASDASSNDEGETDAPELTIGLGLLEGLNRHTADHTLKLSIEVDF